MHQQIDSVTWMMMIARYRSIAAAAATLFAFAAAPAAAQVPWETPQLLAPGMQRGVSVLYVDYGLRPLDGTGVLLMYRPNDAPRGPGFRVAATIPQDDDVRISGGIDITVAMLRHSPTFPLDVVWTSGLGGGYGDYASIGLPVGVSASRIVTGEHVRFQPWTAARVVFETYFGDARPDESFSMTLAAEVGADVSLQAARFAILRTAVSLGDRRAVAIGLHLAPGSGPGVAAVRRQ